MSTLRSVTHLLSSQYLQMGPTRVKQPLPASGLDQVDPFLLLHHVGPIEVPPGQAPLDVGAHPHRGFEPVTFLFAGELAHRDSQGHDEILHPGDVQWMTAGSGIVHSERTAPSFIETGGTFELIQLWVNLPKAHKLTAPRYQNIRAATIPEVALPDGTSTIHIIAGSYDHHTGPAETHSPITVWIADLRAATTCTLPITEGYNATLYVLGGTGTLNDQYDVAPYQMAVFGETGTHFSLHTDSHLKVLLLSGAPLDEPLAHYGPFVMNTQQELYQAVRDYQSGAMGVLEE